MTEVPDDLMYRMTVCSRTRPVAATVEAYAIFVKEKDGKELDRRRLRVVAYQKCMDHPYVGKTQLEWSGAYGEQSVEWVPSWHGECGLECIYSLTGWNKDWSYLGIEDGSEDGITW